MADKRKHLKTLGLSDGASEDDIRKAYKKMALQFHPDKNSGDDAKGKFQEISEAYTYLTEGPARNSPSHSAAESYAFQSMFEDLFFASFMQRRFHDPFGGAFHFFHTDPDSDEEYYYFVDDDSSDDDCYNHKHTGRTTRPQKQNTGNQATPPPSFYQPSKKAQRKQEKRKRQKERAQERKKQQEEESKKSKSTKPEPTKAEQTKSQPAKQNAAKTNTGPTKSGAQCESSDRYSSDIRGKSEAKPSTEPTAQKTAKTEPKPPNQTRSATKTEDRTSTPVQNQTQPKKLNKKQRKKLESDQRKRDAEMKEIAAELLRKQEKDREKRLEKERQTQLKREAEKENLKKTEEFPVYYDLPKKSKKARRRERRLQEEAEEQKLRNNKSKPAHVAGAAKTQPTTPTNANILKEQNNGDTPTRTQNHKPQSGNKAKGGYSRTKVQHPPVVTIPLCRNQATSNKYDVLDAFDDYEIDSYSFGSRRASTSTYSPSQSEDSSDEIQPSHWSNIAANSAYTKSHDKNIPNLHNGAQYKVFNYYPSDLQQSKTSQSPSSNGNLSNFNIPGSKMANNVPINTKAGSNTNQGKPSAPYVGRSGQNNNNNQLPPRFNSDNNRPLSPFSNQSNDQRNPNKGTNNGFNNSTTPDKGTNNIFNNSTTPDKGTHNIFNNSATPDKGTNNIFNNSAIPNQANNSFAASPITFLGDFNTNIAKPTGGIGEQDAGGNGNMQATEAAGATARNGNTFAEREKNDRKSVEDWSPYDTGSDSDEGEDREYSDGDDGQCTQQRTFYHRNATATDNSGFAAHRPQYGNMQNGRGAMQSHEYPGSDLERRSRGRAPNRGGFGSPNRPNDRPVNRGGFGSPNFPNLPRPTPEFGGPMPEFEGPRFNNQCFSRDRPRGGFIPNPNDFRPQFRGGFAGPYDGPMRGPYNGPGPMYHPGRPHSGGPHPGFYGPRPSRPHFGGAAPMFDPRNGPRMHPGGPARGPPRHRQQMPMGYPPGMRAPAYRFGRGGYPMPNHHRDQSSPTPDENGTNGGSSARQRSSGSLAAKSTGSRPKTATSGYHNARSDSKVYNSGNKFSGGIVGRASALHEIQSTHSRDRRPTSAKHTSDYFARVDTPDDFDISFGMTSPADGHIATKKQNGGMFSTGARESAAADSLDSLDDFSVYTQDGETEQKHWDTDANCDEEGKGGQDKVFNMYDFLSNDKLGVPANMFSDSIKNYYN